MEVRLGEIQRQQLLCLCSRSVTRRCPGADSTSNAAFEAAAAALAAGGIPETVLGFDEDVVGPFGAGFAWTTRRGNTNGLLPFLASARPSGGDRDSEAGDFTKVGCASWNAST